MVNSTVSRASGVGDAHSLNTGIIRAIAIAAERAGSDAIVLANVTLGVTDLREQLPVNAG
ncbi:MAG: hypothetical protein O2992_15385 [Gemmatimonadetes bacterium]|nr:hypothetical protein [Gemmatimonadota bacterium]